MFSFILFTVGLNKKKKFDISFLSFNTNAGFRSLFRFIYRYKKRMIIHFLWNWTYERKVIDLNEG